MTAPTPLYGSNPYTGAYQKGQFDTTFPGGNTPNSTGTVFDALANPPEGAVEAAVSPDKVFLENTNPPPGASDNEPADVNPGLDPLYPDNPSPSNP
jgi:hypothetical protein